MKTASVLTLGYFKSKRAKTAHGLIRHGRRYRVVEVIDPKYSGEDAGEFVLGRKAGIPVVKSLGDGGKADVLIVGIAPPGGQLSDEFLGVIKEAIRRGMDIVSGAHMFLSDIPEIKELADDYGVSIWDVRRPPEKLHVAKNIPLEIPVVLTAAPDSSLGKRTAALEIYDGMRAMGVNAAYIATGQTGVMIGCDEGVCVDAVPSDFVSGVVEDMVLSVQEKGFDLAVVEGQGSLSHVAYGPVALGILYGCRPSAVVMVTDPFRSRREAFNDQPIPSVEEEMAMIKALHPDAKLAAIGLRTFGVADDREYMQMKFDHEMKYGVPAVDFIRDPDGVSEVVDRILREVRP